AGGIAEVLERFCAGVGLLALEGLGAGDKLHLYRDFDLQYIDAILLLAELRHGAGNDVGLGLGVGDGLLVAALVVIADELQEERNIVRATLVADALDEGVLAVIDIGAFERRVVEQDLDTVGARFLEAADRPVVEQDGRGVPGQYRGDEGLEFFQRGGRDGGGAGFLRQRFLQRAALIHGGGGDYAALVRDRLEAGQLAGGELDHDASPKEGIWGRCLE